MSVKLVTSKQTDSVKDMANAKDVGRENFQNALDDGRVARFLDSFNTAIFGKLTADCVHTDKDYLAGDEYLRRARAKSGGRSTEEAFDFYAKPENWHLLPDKDKDGKTVEYLVFPDSEFGSDGDRIMRYLSRHGAEWRRRYGWVSDGFGRHGHVAVLAS